MVQNERRWSRLFSRKAIPPEVVVAWSAATAILKFLSDGDLVEKHISQIAEVFHFLVSPVGNLLTFVCGIIWLVVVVSRQPTEGLLAPAVAASGAAAPAPRPLVPILESRRRTAWRPLTGSEVVGLVEFVSPRTAQPSPEILERVKFVANDSGRVLAEQLARVLVALGYEVMVDHDSASYVFAAERTAPGITIRYPRGNVLQMAFRISGGLSHANLRATQVEFPKSTQFDFVQVEIGDWSRSFQWS